MTSNLPILYQFERSHYNEKARWALDFKGIPYQAKFLLPGPHAPVMMSKTGKTNTPVLCLDGKYESGSHHILTVLEQKYPTPALFPNETSANNRCLEIIDYFDKVVGWKTRLAYFSVALQEPDFVCKTFSSTKPKWSQQLYRLSFPVLKIAIAKANGVTDAETIQKSFLICQEALDFVDREITPSGYLVGDQFTAADLTAASLLSILVNVPYPSMAWIEPIPKSMMDFLDRWRAHPTVNWVLQIYQKHRNHSRSK